MRFFRPVIAALLAALPLGAADLVTPADVVQNDPATQTIRLIQDDAQDRMTTKIYTLKHIRAVDIGDYVALATRRYNAMSKVARLSFPAVGKQQLLVTTAEAFIPYVDQIVAMLDRGTLADRFGSKVKDAGYDWQVYWTKFRDPEDLMYLALMGTNNADVYSKNGALWFRIDQSAAADLLGWIKFADRPIPQVKVTVRVYTMRDSTLRDVGVDYLAWKNGPGLNLMDVAFNSGRIAWDRMLSLAAGSGSWAYGGIFTAPAFDLSFIRLLQQSGSAKVAATANLTVTNDQERSAVLTLTPTYNGIRKGKDHQSSVEAFENSDFQVVISAHPTICVFTRESDRNDLGQVPVTPELFARNEGCFAFQYHVYSRDAVEANNLGDQTGSAFETGATYKTIGFGREQLLSSATREYDVEQTIGVPFLCELPVLKYIFGTTTTMKEQVHSFVTIQADLIYPENAPETAKK